MLQDAAKINKEINKAQLGRIFLLLGFEGKICQKAREPCDGGKKGKVRDTEILRHLEVI